MIPNDHEPRVSFSVSELFTQMRTEMREASTLVAQRLELANRELAVRLERIEHKVDTNGKDGQDTHEELSAHIAEDKATLGTLRWVIMAAIGAAAVVGSVAGAIFHAAHP